MHFLIKKFGLVFGNHSNGLLHLLIKDFYWRKFWAENIRASSENIRFRAVIVRSQLFEKISTFNLLFLVYFSNDNYNVTVSSCKRSVKQNGNAGHGYCFVNHAKLQVLKWNQVLKWSLRVPKNTFFYNSLIGMVIMPE